jgi:hypothetical protein
MLAVDQTTGPYTGRVYIAEETDQKGSNEIEDLVMRARRAVPLGGRRSLVDRPDRGRGGEGRGPRRVQPAHPLRRHALHSDVAYPNYAKEKDADSWDAVFATSSDGGVTFSPKKPITKIRFGGLKALRDHQQSGNIDQIGGPTFAIDAGRSSAIASTASTRSSTQAAFA